MLIVEGAGYRSAVAGRWYTFAGNCSNEDIVCRGVWEDNTGCTGGLTTFVTESFAELSDYQQGWWLQPDINCQAWFPIVSVSAANHTITVAGDHEALGAKGKQFRIHAPPGVETRVPFAGTLPKFAEASSSRCLYRGYRYENPLAGRFVGGATPSIAARQGGRTRCCCTGMSDGPLA